MSTGRSASNRKARSRTAARELETIASRARTLDERWHEWTTRREAGGEASPAPPGAMEQWAKAVSFGDRRAFARRLSWDGWDEGELCFCLGPRRQPSDRPPPRWTLILSSALERLPAVAAALEEGRPPPEESRFEPGRTLPFVELWVPFLEAGRALLAERSGATLARLEPGASIALEKRLLEDLVAWSAVALYERFHTFRRNRGGGDPRPGDRGSEPSRKLYDRFVLAMLRGDLLAFFREHSTLARQACRLVETWVETAGELAVRLDRDWEEIERVFAGGRPLGAVCGLETGLSDRHLGGRQVCALRFRSGLRVIYKPRPVNLEAAYNAFLGWMRDRGLSSVPPPLRYLEGDGYGWVELVEQRPAPTRRAAEEYFRRAGSLLCVAWLLRGDDLHAANVIASRDGPVLIDAETLLQPRADRSLIRAGGALPNTVAASWDGSVLRSQLLSSAQRDAAGRRYDYGGLRGRGGHVAERRRRHWRRPNTDAMSWEYREAPAEEPRNALLLDGEVQDPEAYAEDLVQGFCETCELFMAHAEELANEAGPLAAFGRCEARILLRPSEVYGLLLSRLASPRYQRDGLLPSFLADSLNRVFVAQQSRPLLWPLVHEERRALLDLDVPYFSLPTTATGIPCGAGEVVEGYFEASGLEAVAEELGELSEARMDRQVELLRQTLRRPGGGTLEGGGRAGRPRRAPAREIGEAELLAEAEAIGEVLLQRALSVGDESWLLPDDCPGRTLSLHLYDGASGIALFLASLAHSSVHSKYRDLAVAACAPVAEAIERSDPASLGRELGVGACTGLGGVAYALVCISRLLDEARYLELATRAAAAIDDEAVAADQHLDVSAGTAGAILGLLAAHRHCPRDGHLDRAVACGERLLAAMRPVGAEGGEAWAGRDGAFRTGFAHGAAGISHALLRLDEVAPWVDLREAARKAHAFERSFFSPRERNWPPVASPAGDVPPGWMVAWCHGAPGVGLSRLAARRLFQDEALAAEIDASLRTTLDWDLNDGDHLCCGNMGRLEILVEAAFALPEPALMGAAADEARRVLARAHASEGFRLDRGTTSGVFYDPGFFRGISGIGYSLLRLARAHSLPSVLTFQSPR